MDNILPMENIIGSRRCAAYRHLFLYPEAVSVIFEFRCSASLAHLLELTSLLPGIGPSAVHGRIANRVVGNRRTIVAGQLVLPCRSAIGVDNRCFYRVQRVRASSSASAAASKKQAARTGTACKSFYFFSSAQRAVPMRAFSNMFSSICTLFINNGLYIVRI